MSKGIKIELLKGVQGLKDTLRELMENEADFSMRPETITLGKLDPATLAEMQAVEHEREDLQEEIKRKLMDYSKQVQREYDPLVDAINGKERLVWDQIYKQFGRNVEDSNLSYNPVTGEVRMEITNEDDAESKLVQ